MSNITEMKMTNTIIGCVEFEGNKHGEEEK